LLASSTPKKKNTVKILLWSIDQRAEVVAGSEQDLTRRFPDAQSYYGEQSIGGFSSSTTGKTVEWMSAILSDLVCFMCMAIRKTTKRSLK
jgi:hypothetical protein